MNATTRLRPALLTRPVPIVAVLALVLNDHLLKGSGIAPASLTGKLSDVAGLFFVPLLLAELWLLAWPARTPAAALGRVWVAAAATGVLFAAINLSAAASDLYVDAMAILLRPFGVGVTNVADASDLLAMPMLAVAIRYAHLACRAPPIEPGHFSQPSSLPPKDAELHSRKRPGCRAQGRSGSSRPLLSDVPGDH
jgi:hypothetical protein